MSKCLALVNSLNVQRSDLTAGQVIRRETTPSSQGLVLHVEVSIAGRRLPIQGGKPRSQPMDALLASGSFVIDGRMSRYYLTS
jgi:hypothetical protein